MAYREGGSRIDKGDIIFEWPLKDILYCSYLKVRPDYLISFN